jgi:hypothetical protein
MTDVEIRYSQKTVTTVRGLESRSIAKWEKAGWELVAQTPAKLFRTTLAFRKPKKPVPKWVWLVSTAGALLLVLAIVLGVVNEKSNTSDEAATAPIASTAPSPTSSSAAAPVTDADVLAAFEAYFAERASNGVMWGKAVSSVTFADGVVTVTFNPATAGVDESTFDQLSAHFNFPEFASTPICFNDEVGNRLRPAIASINTMRADGISLGTIDAAGILALNGLSK